MGCAIWAYREWVGDLYPPGSRSADFLRLYGQRFTTVEGNTTFYSIPDEATVARWVRDTPDTFRFCLKLPRTITHNGALTPHLSEAIAFIQHMQPLGDRLGPVFAQLPPSYGPDQLEDLRHFLAGWCYDKARLAVEVRHPQWFVEPDTHRLNDLLHNWGVGRVLLDTRPIYDCPDDPQLASERRKPRVPLHPILTTDFTLIRYISHPDWALNTAFIQTWATQLHTWLDQGKEIFWFVHCPVEARSPANARQIQQQLEQQGVPVPPLRWNAIAPATTQLSLFP